MLCISPLSLPRPNGKGNQDRITVPCGKCPACLTNRRNDWAVRLKIEHKHATSSYFITLTYDENNIRYNEFVDLETGEIRYQPTVVKSDLQKFIKRIRKYSECRYYAVGEYGTHTRRPHYHILLFNYDVNELYRLQSSWPFGFIQIGTISDNSIMYVCKYHVNRTDYPEHANPSFALMSRRPGIGAIYGNKMFEFHDGYDKYYYPDHGGVKRRLPRYLRDKIYSKESIENLTSFFNGVEYDVKEYDEQRLELIRRFQEKNNKKYKL